MRAIVKTGPHPGVELREQQPEPETLAPDEVLVNVAAASICGTDLHLYEWDATAAGFARSFPFVMGHECSGVVEAVGSGVTRVKPGDRIAAESHLYCDACFMCRINERHNCLNMKLLGITWNGAFAEYVKLPQNVCFVLPESLPLEMGALLEGTGVAIHALQRAGDVRGATVLVCGLGPIGIAIGQLALHFGAVRAIGIEPNPFRRRLAESLGIVAFAPGDDVPQRVRDLTGVRGGADVAFEVSAGRGVYPMLFASLRRESTIVAVGQPGDPVAIDIGGGISKQGVTLTGVFGRRIWETWELFASLLASGRVDFSWLITHRIGLDEFEDGMKLLRGDAAKVIVRPN